MIFEPIPFDCFAGFETLAAVYQIETVIRGRGAHKRHRVPLVAGLKSWLEDQLQWMPPRGGLTGTILHAIARWPELCRFLYDSHQRSIISR